MKFSKSLLLVLSCAPYLNAFMLTPQQSAAASLRMSSSTESEFADFAASLEEEAANAVASKQSGKQSSKSRSSSSSTSSTSASTAKTWQADLEKLLDPTTPVSQRQQVLGSLMNANEDIRASIQTALRNRNIDPLLTPTQRKLQDGTRAVARQLTNDILPALSSGAASARSSNGSPPPFLRPPRPEDFSRMSNRVFNALSNQMRQNLETLQSDLQNPTRIPERLSKQSQDLLKEATNIFSETPVGLKEPKYTTVYSTESYEIRDYEGYTVASTTMDDDDEDGNTSGSGGAMSITEQGTAFNTLAAYIFGANQDEKVMEMTTPVTTTMSGEMRFYIDTDGKIPEPLDKSSNVYTAKDSKICIQHIPPARLAVRRFTGFVTAGEVARQKQALLAALALDSDKVELDVPHGSTVGHVIFQYNPPYTLPMVRRNEIAVPVVTPKDEEEEKPLQEAWQIEIEDNERNENKPINGLTENNEENKPSD